MRIVKLRLDPEDEYMHALESASNFNESMYFNVYDPAERVGGFLRLGNRAREQGVKLIYEPLNRYETNMFNQLGAGADFLETLDSINVMLLADLFHMNIEEESIAGAIRANSGHIGHLHFADSNRRPVGMGHTDMTSIARALMDVGYEGYASAEVFPWPDPDAAAEQTIRAFRECFSMA